MTPPTTRRPPRHAATGIAIGAHRRAAGLTQDDLAERAGIGRSTLAQIEAGNRKPSAAAAVLLAGVLGVSCEDLLILPDVEPSADLVLLTTAQVSHLLNIPAGTLRQWRFQGDRGPRSFRLGSLVRYRRSDIDAWLADQYEQTASGE